MLLMSTNMWADYYMAGNGSSTNNWCGGKNWVADGCKMAAGSYSTKVPAGTYEFKVTEGDLVVSYGYSSVDAFASTPGYEGSDNVKFTVSAEANINVSFDGMYIVLTSDVPFGSLVVSSWTVAGDEILMGSNWDPADTNNDMELIAGAYMLEKKAFLTEGSYDYKAVANHAWAIKEIPASGNQTLQIDEDGDYVVTFSMDAQGTTLGAFAELDSLDQKNKELSDIAAPATIKSTLSTLKSSGKPYNIKIKRTFYKDGGNNTICLPFSVSKDSLQLTTCPLNGYSKLQKFASAVVKNKGEEDQTLELNLESADSIAAGVPYIISWAGNDSIVNPVFNNVVVTVDSAVTVGTGNVLFKGSFVQQDVNAADKDVIFVGKGSTLNWPNKNGKIKGFRAYFTVSEQPAPPKSSLRGMKTVLK